MDYLKKFGIRLLQIIWIIVVIVLTLSIGSYLVGDNSLTLENVTSAISGIIFLTFILLGIQYLFFGDFRLSFLWGKNHSKIIIITCTLIAIIFGCCLALRYWNNYQYSQKLVAGNDPKIFDREITNIAIEKGTLPCFNDIVPANKELAKNIVKDLDNQSIKGLNKLKILAQRDDQIGINIRCAIYKDKYTSGEIADRLGIVY